MFKFRYFLFLFLCFISITYSNTSYPAELASEEQLKVQLSTLTTTEWGGRGIGSKGHQLARDWIIEQLKSIGVGDVDYTQTEARSYVFWRKNKFPQVENIFARLPGIQTGEDRECVVFSAHYDHLNPDEKGRIRPGANDNGSGVAALIELARVLKARDYKGELDLWFLFPDQEENYIAGSPSALPFLKEKCAKKIWANINLDLVGGKFFTGMENHVLELTGNGGDGWNELLSSIETEGVTVLQNDIYIIEPLGRLIPRSDYASFRENKIPFVFYTSGTPWYYHTRFDTEDKIDYPFLANFVNRLVQIAESFQSRDNFETIKWSDKSNPDYQSDANRFAELILTPYIQHAEANKLDGEEVLKWQERIGKLQDEDTFSPKRLIHQSIIALLSSLEKRAETEMGIAPDGPVFRPEFLKKKKVRRSNKRSTRAKKKG